MKHFKFRESIGGRRFARLVAQYYCGDRLHKERVWVCICDCGNTALVREIQLIEGSTRSCGCLQKEVSSRVHTKHGLGKTKTYRAWLSMKQRCFYPKHKNFKYWGGRGITVCERWLVFENFYADMGDKPEGKSLDRYPNNDGNYEPGNVRWASPDEQANNRRRAV